MSSGWDTLVRARLKQMHIPIDSISNVQHAKEWIGFWRPTKLSCIVRCCFCCAGNSFNSASRRTAPENVRFSPRHLGIDGLFFAAGGPPTAELFL